jgi:hypothetical protein
MEFDREQSWRRILRLNGAVEAFSDLDSMFSMEYVIETEVGWSRTGIGQAYVAQD